MLPIATFVLALIAMVTVHQSKCSASVFSQSPSNATVCQGDTAVFSCTATSTQVLFFVINGMSVIDFTANQSNQSIRFSINSVNNLVVGTLSIVGALEYDHVSIMCRAVLNNNQVMESEAAVLRVLSTPPDLNVLSSGNGTLLLNWTFPSSPYLYLASELYVVEVRTQNSTVLYSSTMTIPGLIPALWCLNYNISVAFVCAMSKGTPSVYTISTILGPGNTAVSYSTLQNCTHMPGVESCFEIQVFINCAGPSYSLSIPSENITIVGEYSLMVQGSIIFSAALPKGRKYGGMLTSQDLGTFNISISTFEIQEMTVSVSDSGLLVTCLFASGSRAKGCLILAMGSYSKQYSVIRRYGLATSAKQTLTGLMPGNYSLRSYDIYEDGNLSNDAASEITGLQVTSMSTLSTPGYSDIDLIGTTLYTSANGLAVCMYCALKDASTIKGCAFIAHQLHIPGTASFTLRTAVPQGTACFNPASPGNYAIAVFDWEADGIIGRGPFLFKEFQLAYVTPMPTPSNGHQYMYVAASSDGSITIIAGVVGGAGALAVVLVAFIILGIVYQKRKRVGFSVTHDDDEKKKDISEQKATSTCYEDLPGINNIDTRIPPAVPPPRTTSDRSLNLRINSQPDEMVELMTMSSSRSSETTERTDVSSPVSMCQSETSSMVSQRTEPQYQVIPETSNLFLLKSSSVSLQNGNSTRSQPKFNNRRHTANTTLRLPAYNSQGAPRFMEATAV